jgi:nucleotide-binding universal stress UspA family protein
MYQRILVPMDGSELAESVLPHVEAVAKGCGAREAIFVRVVEPLRTAIASGDHILSESETEALQDHHEKDADNYLHQLVERLDYSGVTLKAEVIVGKAAESIVDFAADQHVDLIIMATHGRSGVSRWLSGSVAERVLRWSCVPVLMIRPPQCFPKS